MTQTGSPQRAGLDRASLERALKVAERAADAARAETTPRFRSVEVETKADGSPVTEADREAERAIREVLREAYPEHAILGEEGGREGNDQARLCWVIDPIDGTIAFSRGLPLYSTLIALVEDGQTVAGLIDLPGLGERYTATLGGGCLRNGQPVRVSQAHDLQRSLISHGDPFCFERAGQRAFFDRLAREVPFLRGYTDAFGHSLVIGGGVDAMVDLDLNEWDAAATRLLVREAGGECIVREFPDGKVGLVLGSPALVEELSDWFESRSPQA